MNEKPKTLSLAQKEKVIKQVYQALVEQGRASSKKFGKVTNCAYRGENGMKCAVGHLIDDETAARWDGYTDNHDDGSFEACVTHDIEAGIETKFPYKLTSQCIDFFNNLQISHDENADIRGDEFKGYLQDSFLALAERELGKIPKFLK